MLLLEVFLVAESRGYCLDVIVLLILVASLVAEHRLYSEGLVTQTVKHLPAMRETQVRSLVWDDLLEKEMATCSNILAWKIVWMEEPGRLQFMGSQSQTRLSNFTFFLHFFLLVVVIHELSCPEACGTFLDQGSNPCPLHWQADS